MKSLSMIFCCYLYLVNCQHVVWYISPSGSTDISSCGHSIDDPCATLELILSNSSLFVPSESGGCYQSPEDNDGRLSTTVYFLPGDHEVPPVCLSKWSNLAIIGLGGPGIQSSLSTSLGIIVFNNCTNITIRSIRFISSIVGKASIYAVDSTELTIANCSIPVFATASYGVWLYNAYGTINIINTRFYGNSVLIYGADLRPDTALLISQGEPGSLGLSTLSVTRGFMPANVLVDNCTFDRLIGNQPSAISNSYLVSSSISQAVRVALSEDTAGNVIVFQNCVFQDTSNMAGSTVLIRLGDTAQDNTIFLIHCTFTDNLSHYGGGLAVYLLNNASNNTIKVTNSTFINNEATSEGGGILFVSLVPEPTNDLFITYCVFLSNKAIYGAGLFIFNDPNWYSFTFPINYISPPLTDVGIVNSKFESNDAEITEGVVNTLRVRLTLAGDNILTGNNGSAIVLRSSILVASDNLTISHNKAQSGGALKILDISIVNFSGLVTGMFLSNNAVFSGGAVYADEFSTTLTSIEYTHILAANVLGSCFIQFPSTLLIPEAVLLFRNNSAIVSGNHFHIYNLRSCRELYFLPHQFAEFLIPPPDNPVVIDTNMPLDATSTGPNYLYFYGSSCKCYKPVGSVTYMLPNCSHDLLMDNFLNLPELDCGLSRFISEISVESTIGAQIHPTPDRFLLPWSGIELSWLLPAGTLRAACLEPIPGALTLSPAPGEQFDITVQLADQLLNLITGTVFLEIGHEANMPPGALLQLNGIQYAYTDRVYFTPNRALSGLAIVGLPGTEGILNVVSSSQILGKYIIMQIPFKLSQCPIGYYDPPGASTIDEVNDLILSMYITTQRIPADQPLACLCYLDSIVKFGATANFYGGQCISGYTVELNSLLWAGIIPTKSGDTMETIDCYTPDSSSSLINDRFTAWIEAARVNRSRRYGDPNANPVDVVPYDGRVIPGGGAPVVCYNYTVTELVDYKPSGVFSVDTCTGGFCKGDGNSQVEWYIADVDYPCVENRQGPLCGQCKEGLALSLSTSECRDCSNPRWYIPLLTTLIFGLLLVVFAVAFNFGVSPTLDSMLFFTQAVYVIVAGRVGYTSFFILTIFNLDFTFDQCISSDLTALTRLLLQYITPIYIICLLLIVLYMTRIKGLSKFLGNHSFLQALWLLVLLSFLNIANSTFEIIHCRTIGPRNTGQSKIVLVYDASIVCWSGVHLPWGILAVCLAAFVILPFPGYTALAMRFPKLKPITDVYCSIYKDSQRYWVIWDLLRRIVIVVLEVFVVNFVYRHYSLLLTAIFILTVFIWTWPYKYQIDNWFGCFVSIALVLFCVVTQPAIYELIDPHRAVSWTIVVVVVAVSVLLITLEIVLCFLTRRGSELSKEDITLNYLKQMFYLACIKTRIRKKKDTHVQLIESASFAPATSTIYSEYREPLIDSGQFSSVSVRQRSHAKSTEQEESSRKGDSPIIVTHSIV